MELDWLQTFLAVVDRGGFTAASAQVHRSQSRVSAHIAALERDLGVRLIDRSHRPARLTTAGEVFAARARDIVATVGSARSAVGALRGMDDGYLAVLTTPCIGAALFPEVLAGVLARHPGVQIGLVEHSWQVAEEKVLLESVVVAVLPVLIRPLAPGLQEQVLYRERVRVAVARDHEFAVAGRPVRPADLVRQPLILTGTSGDHEPEVLRAFATLGLAAYPQVTVDNPQSLVSLAARGVGVGVMTSVALESVRTDDVVLLDVDDPGMVRDVAAYWYEVLLTTDVGRALHRGVLGAAIPAGAEPAPAVTPSLDDGVAGTW